MPAGLAKSYCCCGHGAQEVILKSQAQAAQPPPRPNRHKTASFAEEPKPSLTDRRAKAEEDPRPKMPKVIPVSLSLGEGDAHAAHSVSNFWNCAQPRKVRGIKLALDEVLAARDRRATYFSLARRRTPPREYDFGGRRECDLCAHYQDISFDDSSCAFTILSVSQARGARTHEICRICFCRICYMVIGTKILRGVFQVVI